MNDQSAQHPGDDLELHALGLLSSDQARQIEAHTATCSVCQARLATAHGALLALSSTLPAAAAPARLADRIAAGASAAPRRLPARSSRFLARPFAAALALAAAFAVAFGLTLSALVRERGRAVGFDRLAVTTIVHSHFSHASMVVAPDAAPLAAKVLYARVGGWIAVLVDRPAAGIAVFATVDGHEVACGPVRNDGSVGSAFARLSGRPTHVELRVGARVLAQATLTYPKS